MNIFYDFSIESRESVCLRRLDVGGLIEISIFHTKLVYSIECTVEVRVHISHSSNTFSKNENNLSRENVHSLNFSSFPIVCACARRAGAHTSPCGGPVVRRCGGGSVRRTRRRRHLELEDGVQRRALTPGAGGCDVADGSGGVAVRARAGAWRDRVGLLVVPAQFHRGLPPYGLQVLPPAGLLSRPAAGVLRVK